MYCVYLIFNTVNGKIYVGKTQNLSQRWKDHLKIAKGGKKIYSTTYSYLHAAINKYGFDKFIIKPVEENIEVEDDAFSRERAWISILKELKYNIYNLTDGGDGTSGHKMSEDGRKRLSQFHAGRAPWNKGKLTPEDVKEKISLSTINRFKNEDHPMKGKVSQFKDKKRSPEFGEKISKSKRGVPKTKEHILATSKLTEEQVREIKNLLRQGISNKEIANIFGVYRDTISRIKNGKTWAWVK